MEPDGNTAMRQPLVIGLNAKAEAAAWHSGETEPPRRNPGIWVGPMAWASVTTERVVSQCADGKVRFESSLTLHRGLCALAFLIPPGPAYRKRYVGSGGYKTDKGELECFVL